MRGTYIKTLTEMARRDEKIVCVIGDTGFAVFEDFEKEFGSRFINVGIAEQNFVGVGAGLAAMGMKPYIYNVVSFMTLRGFEQILLDISYQENPVVMVGVGGGHAYGPAGPTHHSYFDIAMMSLLPNMTVVCPADPVEMKAVMLESENYGKPIYIRIGRSVDPVIHKEPIDFHFGRAIKMTDGKDAVLFACGTMVKDAIATFEKLEQDGIHITVYSMPTIKPLDEQTVISAFDFPAIFTLEEHSATGGLGSAIGDVILRERKGDVLLKKLGFPDMFAPVTGTRDYLNSIYGLDADGVARTIKETLGEIKR